MLLAAASAVPLLSFLTDEGARSVVLLVITLGLLVCAVCCVVARVNACIRRCRRRWQHRPYRVMYADPSLERETLLQ